MNSLKTFYAMSNVYIKKITPVSSCFCDCRPSLFTGAEVSFYLGSEVDITYESQYERGVELCKG